VVPVAIKADEPRDIQPEDDPDMGQADFGDQTLKTETPRDCGTRFA